MKNQCKINVNLLFLQSSHGNFFYCMEMFFLNKISKYNVTDCRRGLVGFLGSNELIFDEFNVDAVRCGIVYELIGILSCRQGSFSNEVYRV